MIPNCVLTSQMNFGLFCEEMVRQVSLRFSALPTPAPAEAFFQQLKYFCLFFLANFQHDLFCEQIYHIRRKKGRVSCGPTWVVAWALHQHRG